MSRTKINNSDIRSAAKHLKSTDAVLASLINTTNTYSVYGRRSSFESLVRIVIGQQLSTQAAATISTRVKALFRSQTINPARVSTLADSDFRKAGVSHAKISTIRSLTSKLERGELSLRKLPYLTDNEIMTHLTAIKGIGPWTVQMYLMFVLHRLDVFPASDKGILNAMNRLYDGNGDVLDIEQISARWRPFRTVACWYLWRYLDQEVT
ncbi:DNA-3-methyladenine glycosylase [Neptuniibacter sp.]|uniref:DNA-3-methyladenine glycosylase family protein n=1 Tax=Neptuniibacter sp. TaxID=1962643 RepID=UPI00345C208C